MSLSTANLEAILARWERDVASNKGHLLVGVKYVPYIKDPYWYEPPPLHPWHKSWLYQLYVISCAVFVAVFVLSAIYD
jgi:hypothetical protein